MSPKRPLDWAQNLSADFVAYADGRRIEEVECIIPDIVGTSRGKAMPAAKFAPETDLALPISLFYQTISGEYVDMEIENQWLEQDVVLRADMSTACAVPWSEDVTVQVICDMYNRDGSVLAFSPRGLLKRIVDLYSAKGWNPVIAPELEFYLTKPNHDPNEPIEPPIGRTGRKGASRQVYSMSAVDEYGPVIDTIYDFAEAQGLEIDTVIQEGGAGQIEINLNHGDPINLADQVFLFKRTIREAALKNGVFATFMAKPIRDEPGSAMHVHQSIVDLETGKNIFSNDDDSASDLFRWFIGGSQKYMMDVVPLLAPYVNSFRRITVEGQSAPANLEWARDNRTTGLRVPHSGPAARRLENRVIGMDANPYIAIATSLACGYLGMINQIEPRAEAVKEVWEAEEPLPASLREALDLFDEAHEMRTVMGEEFCRLYSDIKRAENEEYQREISPWERQHLLLNA
ncbi:glutamine synthetase [Aliiroseovarius halocynthiae]|uniref:Glutamine synthetase n=1 Tax=Aliiroseovarius halocynthiae TaxID=985055 RepID=A0A545SUV6_9RHOB|nr:glutamine synthetase family protein [Aliiroseovarius halocynthiae]TQV68738.1 glutamine synthetase [Aliiroseovarius halocynthiae]SMR71158.1 glutamine synthetase [Aliiroseovarius halocynthiae]